MFFHKVLNNNCCFCHPQLCFRAKLVTAGAANSLSPVVQAARWGHHLLLETSLRGSQCHWMLTRCSDSVCQPRLGSSYTSTRPPAAAVASYSPKEMKCHLKISEVGMETRHCRYAMKRLPLVLRRLQCHLIGDPLPQKTVPKC